MSDNAYIDTSVLGAYYCPEPLSEVAERALRRVKAPVISVLSEVEFASLISRKQRLRELTPRQAAQINSLFAVHVAEGFYRRIDVTSDHFALARRLVGLTTSALSTLDALHLAIAMNASLDLITADSGLARAAKYHKNFVQLLKS